MNRLYLVLQKHLGEYLERLLLILFGVGLGVKILVVNHGIDPRALDLTMMPADFILVVFAPLAVVGLNMLYNKWIPADPIDDQDEIQQLVNEILIDLYDEISDGIDDVPSAADQALEHLPG